MLLKGHVTSTVEGRVRTASPCKFQARFLRRCHMHAPSTRAHAYRRPARLHMSTRALRACVHALHACACVHVPACVHAPSAHAYTCPPRLHMRTHPLHACACLHAPSAHACTHREKQGRVPGEAPGFLNPLSQTLKLPHSHSRAPHPHRTQLVSDGLRLPRLQQPPGPQNPLTA